MPLSEGSVAIKIIQRSLAPDLTRRMIAGESEKSDFRFDQSGGSDWPVNFTLYHYTGFFFLPGASAAG